MHRIKRILLIAQVLLLIMPVAANALSLFGGGNVIWEEEPNVYVKLVAQDGHDYGANDHPVTLKTESLRNVLESLRFKEGSRPVFTVEQADLLGDKLSVALAKAKSNEDVIFSLLKSEKSKVFGLKPNRYFVAGRVFYKLGQFHLLIGEFDRWRNDSAEKAYDPTEVGNFKYQLNHGSRRTASDSVPGGVEQLDGVKNMRFKGQVRNDWIVIDVDRAIASFSKQEQLRKQKALVQKRKEILDALGSDAALVSPRVVQVPVQPQKTVEQRLQTLNELKAKGLISEEEYSAKRQQILNDL